MTGTVDLTIGGPDETRDPYLFDFIGGVTLDPAGRIVVSATSENQIRVYAPDGKHVYSFGQKGTGPGDLSQPCCVTFDGKGNLWIQEYGNRRFSVVALGPDRASFKWSTRSAGGWSGNLDPLRWDARGAVMQVNTESFGAAKARTVRHHVDSAGTVVARDTLADIPADSVERVAVTKTSNGGVSTNWLPLPFGTQFLRAFGPGGQMAEAITSRYSVEWYDANLKRVRTIAKQPDPIRVTASEKAAGEKSIADFGAQMKAALDPGSKKIPATKAPIIGLGFDLDGRLWVERAVPEGKAREADVYDGQGRQLLTMAWPSPIELRYAGVRGTTALGITRDSLGVTSVVRVRYK